MLAVLIAVGIYTLIRTVYLIKQAELRALNKKLEQPTVTLAQPEE